MRQMILLNIELDDSNGAIWDSYNGDRLQVWWIIVEKVPAKHVSIPTLESICDQGGAKVESDWIMYLVIKVFFYIGEEGYNRLC
jgi:hypothetical protein